MKIEKMIFTSTLLVFIIFVSFSFNVNAASSAESNIIKNTDVNYDSVMDIMDLALIASNYNSRNTEENWNSSYDINNDSTVNTDNPGTFIYTGTLTDYNKVITLTLNVVNVVQDPINHGNIINLGIVAKQGDSIYYFNIGNEGKLSRINSDGSSVKKLTDDIPLYINVLSGWVYYCNATDNSYIYKVRTDGTERTKLNSDASEFINVVNGWIYYINNSDGRKIYKMDTDGDFNTIVCEDMSSQINVYYGYVYYTNGKDGGKIYKIKTDGTGKEKVSDGIPGTLNISDGWIYYSNNSDGDKLYKIKVDGTMRTKLTDDDLRGTINILGGYIYYQNYSDSNKIYRVTLDGMERQIFGSLVTITSIDDIYVDISTNSDYTLPKTVKAHMSEGIDNECTVTWNPSAAVTNKAGVYVYEGTVQGYTNKVKLTLTVSDIVPYGNTPGNIINNSLAAVSGDWIYYYSTSDTNGKIISKVKADGTGNTVLSSFQYLNNGIHAIGDTVYYLDNMDLYKINSDGTGKINWLVM